MAAVQQSRYRALAEAQGVTRPFDILVRMPAESRQLIAQLLDCRIASLDPEAQAWKIINKNLRGLQARTHRLPEQLTPFSRNNNWWEIVTRTAHRCGIKFYPGLKDEEVERLLFEYLAGSFVAKHHAHGVDDLDSLAEMNPEFLHSIQSLRLSSNGTRTVMSALVQATGRTEEGLREAAQIVNAWIRRRLRWSWAVSMSTGLRLVQQRSTEIYGAWASQGFLKRTRSNFGRVCAALAVIYFHDLVDRTLEEFEMVSV